LLQLLEGGVPGVVMGCLLARRVPAHKLKTIVATVAFFAGLQLVWSGTHSLGAKHAIVQVRLGSQKLADPLPGASRP
jgi:uncharacterized membrane protein YfcA